MMLVSFLLKSYIQIVKATPEMADIAFVAYCRYGKKLAAMEI